VVDANIPACAFVGRYSVSLIVFCGAIGWFNFGRAGVKIARLQSAKGAGGQKWNQHLKILNL